ncbi:chemotaxis protein CheW [Cohaesibacter celericrescens]|uniref:Chemotaxis protein CheW n=1 Tax=Cohaesibacter celericrescens TaxID=2067669 RepID=A0A2N5XM54_9HYPH|nr:chemotaxis protein CheW [Cohaesibacter celericrescens]PLW75599.1 chemotaxis protein CheW [Cohaesibacter celericrescens]
MSNQFVSEMEKDNLDETIQYVTIFISDQLFGLPISRVHDVFVPESVTRVPMSQAEIAGVLNLRGRIVTAIDMRKRLGLGPLETEGSLMAIGIEFKEESYGLIIDSVGEVLDLSESSRQAVPSNLDPRWADIAAGVHRLENNLMVILDVDRVLGDMVTTNVAA